MGASRHQCLLDHRLEELGSIDPVVEQISEIF
jgi:hypothetical protein